MVIVCYYSIIIIYDITNIITAININRKVAIYWVFTILQKMYSLFYVLHLF